MSQMNWLYNTYFPCILEGLSLVRNQSCHVQLLSPMFGSISLFNTSAFSSATPKTINLMYFNPLDPSKQSCYSQTPGSRQVREFSSGTRWALYRSLRSTPPHLPRPLPLPHLVLHEDPEPDVGPAALKLPPGKRRIMGMVARHIRAKPVCSVIEQNKS